MKVIDNGRENTKVLTDEGERFDYPSQVGEGRDLNLENEPTNKLSHIDLNINDKRYFVGELAEESKYRRGMRTTNKAHEETKILFATALYLSNYQPGERIISLIPINQHRDKAKQELKKILAGEYHIKNKNGGRQFTIHAENIDVVPEGIAGTWDMLLTDDLNIRSDYVGRTIRSIELGSRTTHFSTLIWKNGKFRYLDRESNTEDFGCMELENEKNAFVRRVKDSASSIWTSWKNSESVFMLGGGVLRLEEELNTNFSFPVIHQDPLFANVYGALKLGMIKYGTRTT